MIDLLSPMPHVQFKSVFVGEEKRDYIRATYFPKGVSGRRHAQHLKNVAKRLGITFFRDAG
jgi:hypothetical protein